MTCGEVSYRVWVYLPLCQVFFPLPLGLVVWLFYISFNARWQTHVSLQVFSRNCLLHGLLSSHFGARSLVPPSRFLAFKCFCLHEDPSSAMERGRKKSGVTGF